MMNLERILIYNFNFDFYFYLFFYFLFYDIKKCQTEIKLIKSLDKTN